MRANLFVIACALCACNKEPKPETVPPPPPPGETHAEEAEAPAPGPREMTAQPAEEKPEEANPSQPSMTPSEPQDVQKVAGTPAPMTEGNVIAALTVSNEHEVKVGERIVSKSKNAQVKRYAKMLIKDHGGALKKIDVLKTKLGVEPMDTEAIRQMKDDSMQKISRLDGLTGAELDRAFLEMAVEDHQKTLERIDAELLPAVKSPELKQLMEGMLPTVQHHLDEAKAMLAKQKP
jgi:putative membrane protein